MYSKAMKVHAIRSETPETVVVDLIEAPAEGQPYSGRVVSLPGLTPQEAGAFSIHQTVDLAVTA